MLFLPGLYCLVQNIFHNFCPTLMKCLGNPAREENPTCGPSGPKSQRIMSLGQQASWRQLPSPPTHTRCSANALQFSEESCSQSSGLTPQYQANHAYAHTCIPDPDTSFWCFSQCTSQLSSLSRILAKSLFSTLIQYFLYSQPVLLFLPPDYQIHNEKDPLFIYGVSFYSQTTLPICTACHVWSQLAAVPWEKLEHWEASAFPSGLFLCSHSK